MSYLIDTNVVSELRKGERANAGVRAWLAGVDGEALYLSVLVVGELRKGIENLRRRDPVAARSLDGWLLQVIRDWSDRILPVSLDVAEAWGRFNSPDPLPTVDSLIAATARVHGLTVVTRNTQDMAPTGVPTLDPFR